MSWDVTVKMPGELAAIEIDNEVVSFCNCPGNVYTAVMELHDGKQLRQMERDEAVKALTKVVKELDKKNDGYFSDAWAVASDIQWSQGRETREEWEKFRPHLHRLPKSMPQTYDEFCGDEIRRRVRTTAIRFLMYYLAGCEVTFEW